MTNKVKTGSKVKVHYTGKLDNGEVFDSSDGREPLEFEVGGKQVIPGFENGLIGMSVGDEKDIKIPAKDAYGERDERMIQKVPRAQLPPNLKDAKKGMYLHLQGPDGRVHNVKITDITEEEMILDVNHPLAGKSLNFKVKVVGIDSSRT
jgi:FKBP-type peptidyl-prolyl cis-trans isomerase 2